VTLQPTAGTVQLEGRVAALLELGAGFNPEFTGRENVYFNGQLLGLAREEVDRCFDDIAAFADIGDFIEQPVKTYSSGMYVRLAFAVSASVSPDILIVDEALSVGDFAFNLKCFKRIEQLRAAGCSIVFVSHDVGLVQKLCERVLYLEKGRSVCFTGAADATSRYISDITPSGNQSINASAAEQTTRANQSASSRWPTAEAVSRFRSGLAGTVAGNGAAIIEACDVDIEGGAAIRFGDRMRIRVVVRAIDEVDDLNVSVYAIDEAGQLLIGTSTVLEKTHLGLLTAGQRVAVSFSFENRLREGTYGLTVIASRFITATNFEYLDYLEPATQFRTLDRPGEPRWAVYAPPVEVKVFTEQHAGNEADAAKVHA
jgi:ABC-type multidrug transport system ATPase subunit